jgi:thioredoxin reductase (NADPH)
VRKDFFRAKDLKERDAVLAKPQVKVLFNTEVKEICGNGSKVTGVVIYNNKTKIKSSLSTDGVFLAIGARPNTALVKGQIELDTQLYIVLKNYQETSVQGVFAAGDIADPVFAQAVTAADAGARAALQVKKYLTTIGYVVS